VRDVAGVVLALLVLLWRSPELADSLMNFLK